MVASKPKGILYGRGGMVARQQLRRAMETLIPNSQLEGQNRAGESAPLPLSRIKGKRGAQERLSLS